MRQNRLESSELLLWRIATIGRILVVSVVLGLVSSDGAWPRGSSDGFVPNRVFDSWNAKCVHESVGRQADCSLTQGIQSREDPRQWARVGIGLTASSSPFIKIRIPLSDINFLPVKVILSIDDKREAALSMKNCTSAQGYCETDALVPKSMMLRLMRSTQFGVSYKVSASEIVKIVVPSKGLEGGFSFLLEKMEAPLDVRETWDALVGRNNVLARSVYLFVGVHDDTVKWGGDLVRALEFIGGAGAVLRGWGQTCLSDAVPVEIGIKSGRGDVSKETEKLDALVAKWKTCRKSGDYWMATADELTATYGDDVQWPVYSSLSAPPTTLTASDRWTNDSQFRAIGEEIAAKTIAGYLKRKGVEVKWYGSD